MSPRRRSLFVGAVAVCVLAVAAFLLVHDARALGVERLRGAWSTVPLQARWLCAILTLASFACLGAIERLAVQRALQNSISGSRAVASGVVAHALANTVGLHAVVAPGARLVLYRQARPGAKAIARVLALVGGALVAGVAGCAVIAGAVLLGGAFAGVAVAAAAATALVAVHLRAPSTSRASALARVLVLLPSPALILLGVAESAAAMAALYVLLPSSPALSPAHFVLAFAASAALGVVSHAPGGIGVFEASMLAALPGDDAAVLGALLWFRVIYNLAPFALAVPAFGLLQLRTGEPDSVGRRIERDRPLLPQVEARELA